MNTSMGVQVQKRIQSINHNKDFQTYSAFVCVLQEG